MKCFLLCCALLLPLRSLAASPGPANELRIAAAADLQFAMAEIIAAFAKKDPGTKVAATYGSSGRFRSQILEGAPFDLFFAADTENPAAVAQGKKAAGVVFPYATGRLSLWAPRTSALALDGGLSVLKNAAVRKVAIGNAAHAPYGRIAEEAIRKAGLQDAVAKKLVRGDSIAQAAQFVESGAADVGLIAASLAESPVLKAKGKTVPVDEGLYTPLRQSGVVIKGPREKEARRFQEFFLGEEGRRILRAYGLSPL
jgi:molybdate transport system substrate-binding protein